MNKCGLERVDNVLSADRRHPVAHDHSCQWHFDNEGNNGPGSEKDGTLERLAVGAMADDTNSQRLS